MQSELDRANQNKARISRVAPSAKLMAASYARGSESESKRSSASCFG